VDHAHAAGILHRDLRPGNILLSGTGVLKVTDFGTSRFLEAAAHGTTVIGSPPYMAPEQFHGKAVFASDIYAIGVTMYQMFTGVLPYGTPAPADLERLERGELISSPRLRNPKVPVALADIVLKALAPGLAERYTRAADVLEDVLKAKEAGPKRVMRSRGGGSSRAGDSVGEIQARLRARDDAPVARFCWHCSKPLQARTAKCPFCGESQ
jgi:serine/threonine protein kinase